MRYVEIVPPPAEVDLEFYDPERGHVEVAPLGFVHHEDATIVGTTLVGLGKEHAYVRRGDAVITYPDGTVIVKPADAARAFYAPIDLGTLKLSADNDEEGTAAAEELGLKRKRK